MYPNFIEFIDFQDEGDTYNFGPVEKDKGELSSIISSIINETLEPFETFEFYPTKK